MRADGTGEAALRIFYVFAIQRKAALGQTQAKLTESGQVTKGMQCTALQ